MALVADGPSVNFAYPGNAVLAPNFTGSALVLDATGERFGFPIVAPKAGDIDRVYWKQTMTTGGTFDVRLETNDGSGVPTGTLFGTNTNGAEIIVASGMVETTLTAAATVTKGQKLWVVIVRDAVAGNIQVNAFADHLPQWPYMAFWNGAAWSFAVNVGCLALRYTDGSYGYMPGYWPFSTLPAVTFNSTSTPDERGNIYTPTCDKGICGGWVWVDVDGPLEVVLYDVDGVSVLSDVTLDPDERPANQAGIHEFVFDNSPELVAGGSYRCVVRPGASSVIIYEMVVPVVGLMSCFEGGPTYHKTTAKDPSGIGSWTEVTTERVMMGLRFDRSDDGAGGGGGIISKSLIAGGA